MIKKIPLLLTIAMFPLFLSACGGATYQERVYPYHKIIYSWLGAPISQVRAAWGEPEGVDRLDRNRQAYNWLSRAGSDVCLTTFITDAQGKVINFNPDGTSEGCARIPLPPARGPQKVGQSG